MLVIEISIMTSQTNPLPSYIFPTLTEYECVWLMHSLFPAFLNGCRSLGSYLFVDLDKQTRQLLLALQEQNKDILLVLRDVQICTKTIQVSGGAPRVVGSGAGVSATPRIGATPTGKIREMQERLQASNGNVVQAVTDIKLAGNSGSSSMGFYIMILGYVAMSYIFK